MRLACILLLVVASRWVTRHAFSNFCPSFIGSLETKCYIAPLRWNLLGSMARHGREAVSCHSPLQPTVRHSTILHLDSTFVPLFYSLAKVPPRQIRSGSKRANLPDRVARREACIPDKGTTFPTLPVRYLNYPFLKENTDTSVGLRWNLRE